MKNFESFLLRYLLLMNLSFIMALKFDSFYPIKTIEIKGDVPNDSFGWSVSSAGDINKDGYDDIIVGAYGKNNLQGTVYIIYGGETSSMSDIDFSSSSLTLNAQSKGFIITGKAGTWFGWSVSSAGDINKDGYNDIIIGAPNNPGAAYVIYGGDKSSLPNLDLSSPSLNLDPHTTGFKITGEAAYDSFGYSVRSAGDINKDGYDDLIVGAYGKNGNQGAAYVIYGGEKTSMSNLDLTIVTLNPLSTGFKITGNSAGDSFGQSVSGAGDINNDGYDDIIIGAYAKNSNQGAAYVIYGGEKTSMSNIVLSGTPLDPHTKGFTITGNAALDYFGRSVNKAGDINQDGYDDIIIGAHGKSGSQGAAYVIYGGEKSSMSNINLSNQPLNPLTTGFMITGNKAGDNFGFSVSSAGDINKDKYDDVIIGAYTKDVYKGAAYVIYGGPISSLSNIDLSLTTLDSLKTGFSIFGEATYGRVGISVSAGDFNNDDISDLIIGAYGANSKTGAAYLVLNQCSAHCKTCRSSSQCTACFQSYALENSFCYACPRNCETCAVSKSCDVCIVPNLLYSGQCWASCPAQTFESTDGLQCQDCPAGCSECTSLSACQACLDGYTFSQSQCIKDQDSEKIAAGVFEGSSLAGAALGSGSSLPFNFGLVAKIIRNFKYMKLPVSRELYETFVSWKVASGFMSAPDSWSLKYSSKTIPFVFSRYELQSAFLINFWKPFVMSLIGIAVFAIFKVIEISMNKGTLCTISRQINVAASNFALTQFYSNLDDLVLYFILEMRSTEFETGFRVGSSLLAIVLFLVGIIFVGLHSILITKYQNMKIKGSHKQFETKYENISLIFKDFKGTNLLIQSFLMINVGRSVVSSVIFATLFEYPMIQISFLFVLNILMIFYLWKKKSFKEVINTCSQIFCEGLLFIANVCVFLLALFDHADSYPVASIERLGKCIIVLNFILLFGCAIFMLFSLSKTLYQSYMEKKKAQQQVFPSDNSILAEAKLKDPSLAQSNQSFSTNNGLINESQDNVVKIVAFGNNNNLDKDSKTRHLQGGISNNYYVQNHIESFEMSNSNTILQSNLAEDFGEEINQANFSPNRRLPRSRLVRNREITKARIAQFTLTKDHSFNV